ncbi:hypothetical protein [Flavobacterium sp. 5]|uniref:hypothetical protein n=1 Tax=Flavobacterium sp. 5 TaxID=2035199 RepID=UPI000CC7A2FE|nr:hypothetical protein [Flavobacterium sp. 5]PKB15255.1 hypothetical protein CLU82_0319 [Flavobacterium sp. 5]
MLNWFKRYKYSNYRETLLDAFPQNLREDVENVLDILPFDINSIKLCDGKIHKVSTLIHSDFENFQLDGENLKIPNRVYFNEPELEEENKLTEKQKTILNCIYLRHHNGYLRQNRLERIKTNEYWITPFIFQILGEYVFEILEVIDKELDNNKLDNYKKFAIENPKFFQKTESRIISYWNEYYRRQFPKLKSYIGRLILDQINAKSIGKNQDEIIEIGIDDNERLFLKPKKESFSLIYRTATEINWNEKEFFLYSPKPREWNYYDWFLHIINIVEKECNCKLILTDRTIWTNVPTELKKQIIQKKKAIA